MIFESNVTMNLHFEYFLLLFSLLWYHILDDMKQKVETKYYELGQMCKREKLDHEAAFEKFKKFEDELVME